MAQRKRIRDINLVPIGNSKGVRIPKVLIQKYGFSSSLLLEETDRGILLRKKGDSKLSWEDTYKAMAGEREDWADFETILHDGLENENF